MILYEEECQHAGFDPPKIGRLGKRLEKLARELGDMGVTIFGGAGTGSLRFNDGHRLPLVLASGIGYNIDGGDGACRNDGPDGFMRGE